MDGLCPIHGTKPEWIREKNHFFRLSKYRDPLLGHFEEHPEFLQPEVRRNEILRLLEGGLEDISISRAGQLWGIPLPFDPTSVVYVWFDALINYVVGGRLRIRRTRMFEKWWPADLHVIGKDITRFHCVVWPAMLMSAGLPLPRQVFGHGFVHFKGQKMSKSLGTVLDPLDAASKFGPDPLRLYLVKEIPYGQDGDFSWERFEERYNVDLANNLGNLVNRLAVMVDRYRAGRLPGSAGAAGPPGGRRRAGRRPLPRRDGRATRCTRRRSPRSAWSTRLTSTSRRPSRGRWRRQGQQDRLTQVLSDVVEAVRIAAVLLLPVMPARAPRSSAAWARRGRPAACAWTPTLSGRGAGERVIHKADPLWPRIVTPGTGQAAHAGHAPAVAVRRRRRA